MYNGVKTDTKVTLDRKLCTGCGICEVVCPEVFRMNGEGRKPFAVVHTAIVPEAALNFCRDARDCCKPGAILMLEVSPGTKASAPREPDSDGA